MRNLLADERRLLLSRDYWTEHPLCEEWSSVFNRIVFNLCKRGWCGNRVTSSIYLPIISAIINRTHRILAMINFLRAFLSTFSSRSRWQWSSTETVCFMIDERFWNAEKEIHSLSEGLRWYSGTVLFSVGPLTIVQHPDSLPCTQNITFFPEPSVSSESLLFGGRPVPYPNTALSLNLDEKWNSYSKYII